MEQDTKISMYDVLLILAKGKWMIIIPTVCAMIFAFTYATITKKIDPRKSAMPDRYTSTCEMVFMQTGSQNNPFSQGGNANPMAALLNLSPGQNINTVLLERLLFGETFLLELAASPEFNFYEIYDIRHPQKTNLLNKLKKSFEFEIDEKSSIMTLSYTDVDPQLAWRVLSKALPLLETRYNTLYKNQLDEKFYFFNEQIKEAETNLAKANQELFAFQKANGIYNFESQVQNQFSIYTATSKEILNKELELEFLTEYRPKTDPTVIQKVKEIQKSKELLKEFETGSGRYSMNVIPMNNLQDLSARYAALKREVELRQQVYLLLRQQQEAARMEQSGEISALQILEYPQVPEIKSGPSRGKFCIFVTAAVIFLSVFFVFFKTFVGMTMQNNEDREKIEAVKNALKIKGFGRRRRGF